MIQAVLFAVAMLAIGFVLRVYLKPLHWCFVPAAIVGGFCGFGIVQGYQLSEADFVAELKRWPGILIAVVFACMFLERKSKRTAREALQRAGREGIMVWIIVLGQTAVGLLCTWLLIQPFFDVPNSFGMLIETGFAGGHGTAGAMGTVFANEAIQLEGGLDLGLFMATVGLVMSVLSGVAYVNLAIRFGWIDRSAGQVELVSGLEDREKQTPAAIAKVRGEVLDPLVFQLLLVGLAFGAGWGMKQGVSLLAQRADQVTSSADEQPNETQQPSDNEQPIAGEQPNEQGATSPTPVADLANSSNSEPDTETNLKTERILGAKTSLAGTIGDFPLFIYTLFGGWIVRRLLRFMRWEDLIDNASIQRINAAAMEFLIVAAIATLNVKAVQAAATPLIILLVAAFFWTGFCLLFVAPRLL
ncbi:MAG: sodium/glutamate symporter, partial [Planctomycetota bacterium]